MAAAWLNGESWRNRNGVMAAAESAVNGWR